MIQAVILNLDGILVSTDDCHYRAWSRLAHEQGILLKPDLYRKMMGMKRMDSLKELLKKAERTYTPAEMWALSARKNDLFNEMIDQLTEENILPGAVETVKELKAMGLKVAVASSSENAGGILRQLKIFSLFDAVVDGGDIENGKPDPEVFLLTARKLSMPTGECLVIENSEAGVEAARQAGMKVIFVGAAGSARAEEGGFESLKDMNLPAILSSGAAEDYAI